MLNGDDTMEKIYRLLTITCIFICFLLVLFSNSKSEEIQITTDREFQASPAIYRNIIVWRDKRDENWQIYGYNIAKKKEFHVSPSDSNQMEPAIYENKVVWTDDRNGNYDIYGYDLETKEEFKISDNSSTQCCPKIFGDIVVYCDHRNNRKDRDLYGYNLETGEEFEIVVSSGQQGAPEIYGNIIIWEDSRNYNIEESNAVNMYDIYGYNLATGEEFPIAIGYKNERIPSIYEHKVIWIESEWNKKEKYICYKNLETMEETRIGPVSGWSPVIYGERIAWEDWRKGKWDIYVCTVYQENLFQKSEIQITNSLGSREPMLYKNYLVWEEYRNGNYDIYLYKFPIGIRERIKITMYLGLCCLTIWIYYLLRRREQIQNK